MLLIKDLEITQWYLQSIDLASGPDLVLICVSASSVCLIQQDCFSVEGEDLKHDFERLQLAMEMVGFLPKTRRQWVYFPF